MSLKGTQKRCGAVCGTGQRPSKMERDRDELIKVPQLPGGHESDLI